ncbi:MAG TPA: YceI family protein [Gemmataceae bacterium]|jgi:polyisoprenoid-binding protein YceI|nr:YceI family protein [Gemmataceae bacterium]
MTSKLMILFLIASGVTMVASAARADEYALDGAHAAATFKISHIGLSWTNGRFKDLSGSFTIDPANPATTRFDVTAKAESVDTDNAKRDEHLRSPDFFNAKQFPAVNFKSTSARAVESGYEVTGNLSLHGVTKPITLIIVGGRTAEFPKGVQRTGYSTEFKIKRSEFGMDKMLEAIGDEVFISVSFEGTKK